MNNTCIREDLSNSRQIVSSQVWDDLYYSIVNKYPKELSLTQYLQPSKELNELQERYRVIE